MVSVCLGLLAFPPAHTQRVAKIWHVKLNVDSDICVEKLRLKKPTTVYGISSIFWLVISGS